MRQSVHEHQEHNNHLCETHLGLCKRCDVVYCVECGKEWSAECKLRHASDWCTYPIPAGTTTTDIPLHDHLFPRQLGSAPSRNEGCLISLSAKLSLRANPLLRNGH